MSEPRVFLYDEHRKWWTFEGRGVSLHYQPNRHVIEKPKPALDPVRRSVKARRKRNEETGLPL